MSLPDHERPQIDEILQEPVKALAALGLHRPVRRTMDAFLDHLAEHQVVSAATAAAYAALYQELRYGDKVVDIGVAQEVARRLTGEIERFAQLPKETRDDVIRHVCAEPATDTAPLPEPGELSADSVARIAQMAQRRDPADHLKPRIKLSADNRVRVWGIALILWSVVMLFAGYGLADQLRPLVMDLKYQFMGEGSIPQSLEDLDEIRQFAANHPDSSRAWRIYGDVAFSKNACNEAIMAYHYALVRNPEDAETMNNLAWMYCTAEDKIFRDLDLGLDYAKKAWERSKEPHIADTLAEAYFLNGDREEAVALETQALRMARHDEERQFYKEQLKRFRGEGEPPASTQAGDSSK